MQELKLWFVFFTKYIPGRIGCWLRIKLWRVAAGKQCLIFEGTHINAPWKLIMGDRVSINRDCTIHAGGGVSIGNDVLIGPKVVIYSQNHVFQSFDKPINEQGYDFRKVVIEDDVWIASGAMIMPGCRIGRGAVIGAGTVVRGTIPELAVVLGNPGTIVKFRNQKVG